MAAQRDTWASFLPSGAELVDGVIGAGAVALGIIGLAEGAPTQMYLDAIAALVLGLGLVAIGTRTLYGYAALLSEHGLARQTRPSMGGVALDVYVGLGVVILGVLALLQVKPEVLIPVQVLVLGAGLVFSSGATARLERQRLESAIEDEQGRQIALGLSGATASVQAATGLTAIVLGILAVVGFVPLVLTLVGVIVLGVGFLLSGSALDQLFTAAAGEPYAATRAPRVPAGGQRQSPTT